MTVIQQREALKSVYKNRSWAARVNKMPDEQVQAIYLRLKQQNKL